MAIKNLFGRGVGFGNVHWIVTHGYDSNTTPPPVSTPSKKLPTRLAFALVPSQLVTPDFTNTACGFLDDAGALMASPLRFARTETGPITVLCSFVDGTVEDLSTASSALLTVASPAGTKIVSGVALTNLLSDGTGRWTRLTPQVATAGDYVAQVVVTRADGTIGVFPDAQTGIPVTIYPLVGD